MRVRRVISAIEPRSVQPSSTSPSGREPRLAKWSNVQQLSKPWSSAMRHTVRSWSTVVNCGASFSPMRVPVAAVKS